MYTPAHFREHRTEVLHDLLRAHPLAAIVDAGGDGLDACHVPLMVDAGTGRLRGHVARANPLWERADGAPVLCLFQGAQGYVTPSWYASKAEHGKVVPTWNYMVVHVRGRLRAVHDRNALRALVGELTDTHEGPRAAPWAVDDAPDDYVEGMLHAIVGIEITIESIEGAWKMSQNKRGADLAGVLAGAQDGPLGAALRSVHGEDS